MAVQDYKINYKSDFVLTINGDAGWAVPFCIKFWTGMPSQAYFVGFDGVKYVNCRVGDTPTQLLVMFDDHHLPIGKLMMQIAYHTTIEEFPGSVFDEVTNARDVIVTIDGTDYQVMLDFTGEDSPELEFNLPAYANEAERIQNELQRQQNEADRIAAELQREQATAAAVQGAENVNAQLNGTTLTVTNRQGVSTSVNTKGEQGEQGPVGPEGPQGEQGETGISIVSFTPKSETSTTLIYTVTFSDGHTQDVAIPKGAKGDTGATGQQGPQGDTGVSITAFTYSSETETDMIYTVTFSDGTTQQVAIPKGAKGDTGEQGPAGPTGPQGPMGDVAVITPEQQAAFTMYSIPGQNTDGPMTQKAVTDALNNIAASGVSYDNSQSGLAANNVQGALDETLGMLDNVTLLTEKTLYNPYSSSQRGFINTSGGVTTGSSSSPYRYTSHIKVYEGDVIHIHSNFTVVSTVALLAAYDDNKTFINGSVIQPDGSGNQDVLYTVPAGVSYIRLSARVNDSSWSAKIKINPKFYLQDGNHSVIEYNPSYILGWAYLNLSGGWSADRGHNWKWTYPFKVMEGDEVYFCSTNSASSAVIQAYTSNNIASAMDTVAGQDDQNSPQWHKYIVPIGAQWMSISHKYTVDGALKVYIKRKIEKLPKKSISILFIGNSMTQDAVAYLPILMREYAPDVDYKFYIWYNPAYTLAQQLSAFNSDAACKIFSVCDNSTTWLNTNDSVKMSSILSSYTFDIVCLQEYFNYKTEYTDTDIQTYNDCISYILDHYTGNKPFKVATLFHAPLRVSADSVFDLTKQGIGDIIKKTVTEILFPSGIAIYRALSIPQLDDLGNQGHLSNDGTHAQEGLPSMLENYVSALTILQMLSIPMSVNNTQTVVSPSNFARLGVPGPNPQSPTDADIIVGTTEQVRLAQQVAIKAFKEGEYFVNANLTEYTTQ